MSLDRGRRDGDGQRGQSLVEFALILPVLLLLALIAIDFGRIYLGWINLQNMARIGANYAANNADAIAAGDSDALAAYAAQIAADAQATNCPLAPGQPAVPSFEDTDGVDGSHSIGDRAAVTLTCRFHVVTPLISLIVGSDINVSATAAFPVKVAMVETSSGGGGGGGGGCLVPSPAIRATPSTSGPAPLTVSFMDASGGGTGTDWAWDFGDGQASTLRDPGAHSYPDAGTYVVTLRVRNACGEATTSPGTTITVAATPALCTVPNFNGVQRGNAQGIWTAAGFNTQVQPTNGNFKIKSQSIVAGSSAPCTGTTITVSNQ